MGDEELSAMHQAYVQDISDRTGPDRTGLPPHAVAPVFHDILQALGSDATVETFVVLLAAKKTLAKLKKMSDHRPPSKG